ncbi:uncharacterized protein LOC141983858 [Natator depressus]|uniref:uncharacterized protein LOC141983858 n=1 Tax=Natator depressus TaxID=27790 RepID=UPI003EBAA897
MPPRAGRSPVWSNGELLDHISVWGKEAVQSQLCSSSKNYDLFRQISRAMLERGHDRDALQCRVKVKELRNAYRKAREANSCFGAAPATCRFYKELDAILRGDPTYMPSTTMDTSEASATRQEVVEEEEQQSRSKGAPVEEDTLECSQELFSSQEEGSQLQRLVLGEGQTPEEVPDATVRSQPSVFSTVERLQRIRKRPHKSKEDMLHEVMQHSTNENQKVQEWRDSERRICQENEECQHKSAVLQQQSMDWLMSIMQRQANSIQAFVVMQVEHYCALPHCSRCPKTLSLVAPCHLQPTFPNIQGLTTTSCLQHL